MDRSGDASDNSAMVSPSPESNETTTLSEHRSHLSEHVRRVAESGRPLFLREAGEPGAVLLSEDAYAVLVEQARLAKNLSMIDRSLADIEAGRTEDAREAMRDIARECGLRADR